MGMEIYLVMMIFVKNICTRELYASLLKAVPAGLVQLIIGALCYSSVIPRLGNLIISGINFTEQSCNNKVLRTLVNTQIFPSKVKKRPLFLIFLKIKWFELEQDFSLFHFYQRQKKFSLKLLTISIPVMSSSDTGLIWIVMNALFVKQT